MPADMNRIEAGIKTHIDETMSHLAPGQTSLWDNTAEEFSEHLNDEIRHITDAFRNGINNHINDNTIHITAEERAEWNRIHADHEARISRLEDALYSNITGNPFVITFGSLDGITLESGVWNVTNAMLEC
jgi:hypothetical protein